MPSKIIDFYNFQPNDRGFTLWEIWDFSNKELEHNHFYIQWLFPIIEPDYWNRETPKLCEDDIIAFRESYDLQTRLVQSFIIILAFWGFDVFLDRQGEVKVDKAYNYEERSKNWQTGMNHNFLRITRVLHCLNDLGMNSLAKVFYNCLMDVVEEAGNKISPNSVSHWKNAMVQNMKGEKFELPLPQG